MSDHLLDCQGLNCPMPIVEITKAIRNLQSGQVLEVLATDMAFRMDLEAWARRTGHTIEAFEDGEIQRTLIRVK
ncbi:MAG: sulfurtransferase TusA family protein [Planctomycetales bacterium]|nr:sulfurtransferase TusA family protein [Planctomycetales bacterium]